MSRAREGTDVSKMQIGDTTLGALMELAGAFGAARVARGASSLLGAAEASALKQIRDRKLYVGAPAKAIAAMTGMPPENFNGKLTTFEEFCKAIGQSRQRVYERIGQLEMFEEGMAHVDELGVPNRVLRLAMKTGGDARSEIVAAAKDPKTTRENLVNCIQSLAEANKFLEQENEGLHTDTAEMQKNIERGRKQLQKLDEQLEDAKHALAAVRAGKVIDPDDEEALEALGTEAAGVLGFFERLSRIKWKGHGELALAFGSLVADSALDFADRLTELHAGAVPDRRQRKAIQKRAEVAKAAADAIGKKKRARAKKGKR